jgi:outer membrane lipoprotein carrier protein
MNSRIMAAATITVTAIATMAAASIARAPLADVNEIVRKTKALYDGTTSAEVRFEQTGGQGTMSGTLQFAKGNKYRLEFPKQTIVSNGTTVWTYTPARKQVIVSKAKGRSGGMTPNEILTKFPGSYRPTLIGERSVDGRNVWVVRCDAGAEKIGDVTRATLYIDKSSNRFSRIELESPSMGSMTVKITQARYNIPIPSTRFEFSPPAGSRVINMGK